MSDAAVATATTNNNEAIERVQPTGMEAVILEEKRFELAQRKAAIYAKSSLVPKEYQNNIGNVLIAENMAHRMGADTLMVMQNLYIVHGKPGWSAVFLIGSFNSNGRFSAIKYRFTGDPKSDDYGCTAWCRELATGDEITGTMITRAMAKKEGWATKNGSKWMTMEDQMMRYRAATFLIRSTAPEIGLGLLTKEELDDLEPENFNGNGGGSVADKTRANLASLKERLTGSDASSDGQLHPDEDFIPTAEAIDDEPEEAPAGDAPKLSKTESQRLNHIAWIQAFEKESDENGERVAQIIADGELDSMTAGQVKEIYLELQK